MTRSLVAALALAAVAAFAVPALAHERGDAPAFPMAGNAFVQHVDARLAKQSERVERMITKRNFAQADADALRAKVAERAAKVRAEAQKAAADGTVTKEEAEAVRAVAREGRPWGGHGRGRKAS